MDDQFEAEVSSLSGRVLPFAHDTNHREKKSPLVLYRQTNMPFIAGARHISSSESDRERAHLTNLPDQSLPFGIVCIIMSFQIRKQIFISGSHPLLFSFPVLGSCF